MKNIYLVVSPNDLGVDVHGAYTNQKLAESARDKLNAEAKASRVAEGRPYYGNSHYILSGPVNQDPSDNENWGTEDLTGYRKDRSDCD